MPPTHAIAVFGHRIYQGERIELTMFSNVAEVVFAFARLLLDDGTEQWLSVPRVTTGSLRAQDFFASADVARRDGWVVDFTVSAGGPALQRGQLYVRGSIGPSGGAVLGRGYLYSGHDIRMDEDEEPGPAGGHGAVTLIALAQPAAGVDYATIASVTGAMRKLRTFFGQLVTGAGVANREFSIQVLVGAAIQGGVVAGEIQTASLTVDYVGSDGGVSSSGVTSNLAGGVTQIGLGNIWLFPFVTTIGFKTYNIQAADQWGAGILGVEEWVMPN